MDVLVSVCSALFLCKGKFKQEADFTNKSTRIVDRVSGTVCSAVQREAVYCKDFLDGSLLVHSSARVNF